VRESLCPPSSFSHSLQSKTFSISLSLSPHTKERNCKPSCISHQSNKPLTSLSVSTAAKHRQNDSGRSLQHDPPPGGGKFCPPLPPVYRRGTQTQEKGRRLATRRMRLTFFFPNSSPSLVSWPVSRARTSTRYPTRRRGIRAALSTPRWWRACPSCCPSSGSSPSRAASSTTRPTSSSRSCGSSPSACSSTGSTAAAATSSTGPALRSTAPTRAPSGRPTSPSSSYRPSAGSSAPSSASTGSTATPPRPAPPAAAGTAPTATAALRASKNALPSAPAPTYRYGRRLRRQPLGGNAHLPSLPRRKCVYLRFSLFFPPQQHTRRWRMVVVESFHDVHGFDSHHHHLSRFQSHPSTVLCVFWCHQLRAETLRDNLPTYPPRSWLFFSVHWKRKPSEIEKDTLSFTLLSICTFNCSSRNAFPSTP